MSRFHGRQHKGAMRLVQTLKRRDAEKRQAHAISWGKGVPCPEHNNRIHSR